MSPVVTPPFTHHRPTSLRDALEILGEHKESARLIAGGTDLVNKLRSGAIRADHLVSLNRVQDLDRVRCSDEEGLSIGATARISAVGETADVRRLYPALAHACSVMATTQIRNMGTVAGNLANGSPCADTAGPLLVYDAVLVVADRGGQRRVPLAEFFQGPGLVDLRPTEIVERIEVPAPGAAGSAYQRISARSRVDMSAASVAGLVALDADGRVSRARLALGAVGPTPMRCPDAEQMLTGQTPDSALLERVAAACASASLPIDDLRATADWRRAVVGVLARRVLEQCLSLAQGGAR
jgi:carbon-monoxide dehydrogenase medium subunit